MCRSYLPIHWIQSFIRAQIRNWIRNKAYSNHRIKLELLKRKIRQSEFTKIGSYIGSRTSLILKRKRKRKRKMCALVKCRETRKSHQKAELVDRFEMMNKKECETYEIFCFVDRCLRCKNQENTKSVEHWLVILRACALCHEKGEKERPVKHVSVNVTIFSNIWIHNTLYTVIQMHSFHVFSSQVHTKMRKSFKR